MRVRRGRAPRIDGPWEVDIRTRFLERMEEAAALGLIITWMVMAYALTNAWKMLTQ